MACRHGALVALIGLFRLRGFDMLLAGIPRSFAALLGALLLTGSAAVSALDAGTPAPAFRLQDQNGDWHALEDYRGQWVAMYFYPKDDTPGCTREACAFRDDIFKFKKMGVKILGVSLDDVESHQEFAEKYSLPFTLLSDADGKTAGEYGVLRNYGAASMASRQTFLIDPEGRIARHYPKVNPDAHSVQVLTDLASLMAAAD
jgi:peroxiredoxin Q/BCP